MKPRLVLIVLALFVSLLPTWGRAQEESVVVHPLSFGAPVKMPQSDVSGSAAATCYNPCGEPLMDIAPDGTIYVTTPRTLLVCCNSKASPLWKSTDGGKTFSPPIFPKSPGGAHEALSGGDTQIAIDKRGTLFLSELWLGNDSMYISEDQGATWKYTTPAHHFDPLDDREWLAYSKFEDAVYGVYNSIEYLIVIKADLTTPLGPVAAMAFPQEVPIAINENSASVGPDEINGMPVRKGGLFVGPPGQLSIDQSDGTVYVPFGTHVNNRGLVVARSTNGGLSWTYSYVNGAGHGSAIHAGTNFPVSAVDKAGNVYVTWSEDRGSGFHVYLTVSKDKGTTWSTPVNVSNGYGATNIFPVLAAGAGGRVAVGWYGTAVAGHPNSVPPDTKWNVFMGTSIDAGDGTPGFEVVNVNANFHTGTIWTVGGSGDRKLIDFFDAEIEPATGAVMLVYPRDKTGGKTEVMVAKQSDGCNMLTPGAYIGPGVEAPPGTPPTVC